jgi:hypothetical protein
MIYLARRLGYLTEVWQDGAKVFEQHIQKRMDRVRNLFIKQCPQSTSKMKISSQRVEKPVQDYRRNESARPCMQERALS